MHSAHRVHLHNVITSEGLICMLYYIYIVTDCHCDSSSKRKWKQNAYKPWNQYTHAVKHSFETEELEEVMVLRSIA